MQFKRILVVDDEENIRHMLTAVLVQEGLAVDTATDARNALKCLAESSFDLLLTDVRMPGNSGLELLTEVKARYPNLVVIVMSAYGSIDTAVEAIKLGAFDYVAKPFKPIEVVLTIRKAEERERLRCENRQLRSDLAQVKSRDSGHIVARNKQMQQILKTVRKIAAYKTTVLIQGESGTGKELIAHALHEQSPRKAAPFVAVNCGAIPDNLLESELFGHRKGAFTDASRDKAGLIAEADGGTLFLDEVGELPIALQVKLLRALQEEQIRRVGDAKPINVDVRVVAATARDLQQEVASGRFREDLFYRINVMPIYLPPLRERADDIPALIEHAIRRHNGRLDLNVKRVSPDAMRLLLGHRWPGNVRELENTLEHAMVLTESDTIESQTLPQKLREQDDPVRQVLNGDSISIKKCTRIVEETLIRRALAETEGNRTSAARLLDISHRALLYKIKDYGITEL